MQATVAEFEAALEAMDTIFDVSTKDATDITKICSIDASIVNSVVIIITSPSGDIPLLESVFNAGGA